MARKELKDLSKEDYATLLDMGYLFELYPEATGCWEDDCGSTPVPRVMPIITGLENGLRNYLCYQAICEGMTCSNCVLDKHESF